MQTTVIDRVFARREPDRTAQEKFEVGVGWRYGLLFGIVTVLAGWGYDACQQFAYSMEMPGVKFAIVAVALISLTTLAGVLAGRAMLRSLVVWSGLLGAMGVVGLLLSFAGPSIVAMLFDSSVRDVWIFPITSGLLERIPLVALFGGASGLLAGGLQRLATHWAWDATSSENRFTRDVWLRLLIFLPVALTLGALYDGSTNAQFRAPFATTQRIVQVAHTMPPGLDRQTMSVSLVLDYAVADLWRDNFSARFTQHVAAFNAKTLTDVVVDAEFDNGFVWRCETAWGGYILKGCIDLGQLYPSLLKQFLTNGTAQCDSCVVRVEEPAAAWRRQQSGNLGDAQSITLEHRAASVVLVRARAANGGLVECQFVGAAVIQIRQCRWI